MRVVALPVGAILYLGIQQPNLAPAAIPTVAAQEKSVAPAVVRAGTRLHLQWDNDSAAIRDAASGELIIWDVATEPRVFVLTSDELHHGSALYLDAAGQLRTRLFVIGTGSRLSEIPVAISEDKPAD